MRRRPVLRSEACSLGRKWCDVGKLGCGYDQRQGGHMRVLKRGGYALQMWGRHMHVLTRRGCALRMWGGHTHVVKRSGDAIRKEEDGGGHIEEDREQGEEGKGIDGGKRDVGTPAEVHRGAGCC